MARPGFKSQLGTLLDRTVAIHLGSLSTLVILMVQPPLVGLILGAGWSNQEATAATYLCMAIAAVYIGCMNAATSIVREREVFNRERMFCLNIWAYLLSKTTILSVVCAVQMVLLLVAQTQLMHLPGVGTKILMFFALWLTALAATGLGLAISAFSRNTYMAVILVPVLLIPQIVFSRVVLGESGIAKQIPSVIEKITLTKWGFQALETAGKSDTDEWVFLSGAAILVVQLCIFLLVAALKLKTDEW